jgi:hypothetical protein
MSGFSDEGGCIQGSKALLIVCITFITIMLGTMAFRDILCSIMGQ